MTPAAGVSIRQLADSAVVLSRRMIWLGMCRPRKFWVRFSNAACGLPIEGRVSVVLALNAMIGDEYSSD